MNGWNFTKFAYAFNDIDKEQVGIVLHQIVQIYNRVIMALDSIQN